MLEIWRNLKRVQKYLTQNLLGLRRGRLGLHSERPFFKNNASILVIIHHLKGVNRCIIFDCDWEAFDLPSGSHLVDLLFL